MGVRQNHNPIGKRLRVKGAGVGTACKKRRQRNLAKIQCEEGMQNVDKVYRSSSLSSLAGGNDQEVGAAPFYLKSYRIIVKIQALIIEILGLLLIN